MNIIDARNGTAEVELSSILEMTQVIELIERRSFEGIYILWNDPHEVWTKLCESNLHIGLRGANWSIVKDIPMLTINEVGIVMIASRSEDRYGYFSTDTYKVAKSIQLKEIDILDLDDPQVPSKLMKLNGTLMGWDFETRGFPLEVGFKPLGFSLVNDDYGLYLNFRRLTKYDSDIFKVLQTFLIKNQRNLITYNCKFEMSCFLQMFNKYIYPLDAMAILSCDDVHTNLKAAAQMYLSVPSWDDELDAEMKLLDMYMKTKDQSIIDQIVANRLKLDPMADISQYKSIKDGYGNAWEMCYPPALAKYCIYDSYYTLKIWEKVAPKYSDECIDIFHRNHYHGMYLACNPMPLRVNYLEQLINECKTVGTNADGYLNRLYGELLELKYGDLDYESVIDPVHIKLIEYGYSSMINDPPAKILKAVFKRCFTQLEDGSYKLTTTEPLVQIYGKYAARKILTSATMSDIRGRKVWDYLVQELSLTTDTELVKKFNQKYNSKCLEYIQKFSDLAKKSITMNIDVLMRFRNLFYIVESDFRKVNKAYKPITDKILAFRKDKKKTQLLLSYVNPQQYDEILNSRNPKVATMKSMRWYKKFDYNINKMIQALSDSEFKDDLVGFSDVNFTRYGDWIAFDHICDLIMYRKNKAKYAKLDEITLFDKPESENLNWIDEGKGTSSEGPYPELINATSAIDSAKLMDIIDLNFHDLLYMNLNKSRNNLDHAVWSQEEDVYSYENIPDLYEPRMEFNTLTGMSYRKFFLDKWTGANTFPQVYGSRLYKDGHYKKGREKLTLPKDPNDLYYLVIQYSYTMFTAAKQLSPYLQGEKGFDTKRYKRVKETDQYTIMDKTQKGDGFEVRFNIAEKSTKRSSSFYHTLSSHGNDESTVLGLTDKQLSEGKVISYFDISQMEPRTC